MNFQIEDFDRGRFSLNCRPLSRRFTFTLKDSATPGAMLLLRQEKAMTIESMTRDLAEMTEAQKVDYLQKLERNTFRVITGLAMLVECDEDVPSPFENLTELLAGCMDEKDPGRIYAFFLINLTSSSQYREMFPSESQTAEVISDMKKAFRKNLRNVS